MDPFEFLHSTVDIGNGRANTMIQLIDGWARHVLRLYSEASQEEGDNPWGVHDLVAALKLRDRISSALPSGELSCPAIVQTTDELFRSFTTPDQDGILSRVGWGPARDGWWWHRVPMVGPVADELTAISEKLKQLESE